MNTAASRANELERRLISFAAAIVSLSSKLPRTPQGRHHICGQILRSGTAAAANYGEARGAESRREARARQREAVTADFIHKLKIVFKELNETTIYMAGSHRRKFLAFTGNHCRDCRGKPRTLSHYRRLYQDCPGVHRMIEPESTLHHWVIRSVRQLHYTAHNRPTDS